MKKILLLLIIFCIGLFTASAESIDSFIQRQKEFKNVEYAHIAPEAINIASKIVALATLFDDDTSKKDKKIIGILSSIANDIEDVEFIASKNKKRDLTQQINASNLLTSNNYKLLNEVKLEDEVFAVYSKEVSEESIKNLIIIFKDIDDDTTLIANITGDISIKKVAKMIALAK